MISGNSLSQINERFPTKFKAHPFAFKIWWFIYILFFMFVLFGLLPSQQSSWLIVDRIGLLFVFKSAAAVLWMYFYTANNIWLSTIFVWISWAIALAIYIRLGIHYGDFGIGRLIPGSLDYSHLLKLFDFFLIVAQFHFLGISKEGDYT